ncbi:DUF3240 family protein [Sphingomonas quercus]|uniref:DUF3240 family protein n=1 Tax=Sphingomonas quercus TaxID=2842451 RepID=A0ABS6BER6_9SPHN|nr:DUF3240 family protein [Sphingomonas quercus]MBU3076805.1 DUF3240 family protein [Sphingomonas quercus]
MSGEGTVLLSIACASGDRDAIVEALRARVRCPIHLRAEAVHGLDFSDAGTAERVTGALDRLAIELVVPADAVTALVEAAGASRRRLPMRWRVTPVLASGRVA